MWLGAASADCLLSPWLVDHAARVCVGGVPPAIVAVVVVAADHLWGWAASEECEQPLFAAAAVFKVVVFMASQGCFNGKRARRHCHRRD